MKERLVPSTREETSAGLVSSPRALPHLCPSPDMRGTAGVAGNSQTFLKIATTEGFLSGLRTGMIFELFCSIPLGSSAGRDTSRTWQTPESCHLI